MGDITIVLALINSLAQLIANISGNTNSQAYVGQAGQLISLILSATDKISKLGSLVTKLQAENRAMTPEEWDMLDHSLSLAAARTEAAITAAEKA
jgi:hypothetical protein